MRRERLSITALPAWARLNNVDLRGVEIRELENGFGCGIVSTTTATEHGSQFLVISPELVLNVELVWIYAKNDPHLQSVLEANGEFAKTPRGAILIYLIMALTYSSPDMPVKVGVSNAWTDYVKFIADEKSLPTFWTEPERQCLWGTSLESHVQAKLHALDREFTSFHEATQSIDWCQHWWDAESGCLSLEDWKVVDAMYRSRAMDFDEYGLSLVPVMDMANHNGLQAYKASYNIDKTTRSAVLALEYERSVKPGDEVTIMYGLYRSAADSLFSYGFTEQDAKNARSIFLSFAPPEDDPLAFAKIVAFDIKPGFKVYTQQTADMVAWSGDFIWAMCINEEDGLKIEVVKTTEGGEELKTTWKGKEIVDPCDLERHLQADYFWDLFQLRAYSIIQSRIEEEILKREQLAKRAEIDKIPKGTDPETSVPWKVATALREGELRLLRVAASQFQDKILWLSNREAVDVFMNHNELPAYGQGSADKSRDDLGNMWEDGEDGWTSPQFKTAPGEWFDLASWSESEGDLSSAGNRIGGLTAGRSSTPIVEESDVEDFS